MVAGISSDAQVTNRTFRRALGRHAGRGKRDRSAVIAKAQDIRGHIRNLVRCEDEVWHLRVRARQEDPDRRCRHPANVRNVVERWSNFKYSRRSRFRVDHMTGSASFACEGVPGPNIAVLRFRAESRCG